MQKIYYEKLINLNHQLKDLVSLAVDDSINYKIENDGVRAIGNLFIKGKYNDQEEFKEIIDLDVKATYENMIDQRDFAIKVDDFDYKIQEGNILVNVVVGVHGVKEGEDKYIKDTSLQDAYYEIEALQRDIQEEVMEEPSKKETKEIKETTEPVLQEEIYPDKSVKDNDEDDEDDEQEDVGTYYLYVVNNGDTYDSIASKYHVPSDVIKNYNDNEDLASGKVIIIPYVNS